MDESCRSDDDEVGQTRGAETLGRGGERGKIPSPEEDVVVSCEGCGCEWRCSGGRYIRLSAHASAKSALQTAPAALRLRSASHGDARRVHAISPLLLVFMTRRGTCIGLKFRLRRRVRQCI